MFEIKLTTGSFHWTVDELKKLIESGKAYRLTAVEWRDKRSLSQNAMYWAWLDEINKQNPLRVDGSTIQGRELWHEVFKKFYCPEKQITNGKTVLSIKSTKMLDVGEMTFYLNKIEGWCMDRGVMLSIPESSEYYQLMKSQNG